MLNADSSTLKSESDDQSRNARADDAEAVGVVWMPRHSAQMLSTDALGKSLFSSVTK